MAKPFLKLENVTKRVRDGVARRALLQDVNLEIEAGEVVVVRGPSGSGKTTLLAVVGAMLAPTSGEVTIDGVSTSRLREPFRASFRRRSVGFVFQDLLLIDGASALENVLLPQIPDGVSAADELRAMSLLERFELGSRAKTRVRALSGGERQRIAMARALLRQPPLLLLDEPTAHVDDRHVESILRDLHALAEGGRTVVVATHDARIRFPRERSIRLHDGTVHDVPPDGAGPSSGLP